MVNLRAGLVVGSLLVAACGGPPKHADAPIEDEPASSAAPVASAPAAPVKDEPRTVTADVSLTSKKADEAAYQKLDGDVLVMVWEGLPEARAFKGKRAWVPAANMSGEGGAMSFAAVRWTLVDVVSADDKRVVYEANGKKYAVPTAVVVAPGAAPKKGDIVRCSFGGSYALGRFEGTAKKGAECSLRFMGKTRKETMAADGAWAVPTQLAPGAVVQVTFPGHDDKNFGDVYAVNGDDVWVDLRSQQFGDDRAKKGPLHRVKKANVTVLEVSTRPLAKGDAVLTRGRMAGVAPAVITEVIDGGLAYRVKGEDVRDEEIEPDQIVRAKK